MKPGDPDWPRFVRECGRKTRYLSAVVAERVREECEEKRNVKLRTYQCSWCQRWHLTSTPT